MPQKIEAQRNIRVEIEALWRTFAKDFTVSWAKVLPDTVMSVTILEGDGGLQFKPGGPTVPFQKTKIVEFESTKHQLGLEILVVVHLSNGFTKYVTYFKFTKKGERETSVQITVVCEPVSEEADLQAKTTKFPLLFFRSLEAYLDIYQDTTGTRHIEAIFQCCLSERWFTCQP